MKKEEEVIATEHEEIIPVTINGIVYLTFPQAQDYVEFNRERLRQRVLRDAVEGVVRIGKYLFIPLSYLDEERRKGLDKETEVKLEELKGLGLTKEDIERFIAMKKAGGNVE
ncbi:MAG: hypothetical protein WCR72_09490 [Bacteroidota bacterium]